MAKLHFIHPNFAGITYGLVSEKTTVGRSEGNTLVIHHDSVSAHHCEILVHGAEVIVRDLGSRNGTFVDGVRLQNQQSPIKSGHTIRFGSVEARVEIEPESTEGGSDMTAIASHARAVRDQRRAASKPAANPVASVDPIQPEQRASSKDRDSTVALSPPPVAQPPVATFRPSPDANAGSQSRGHGHPFPLAGVILIVIGIAVTLLVVFLWLH